MLANEAVEGGMPAWHEQDVLLRDVHDAVVALDSQINYELSAKGYVVRYFRGDLRYPFAIIDAKKQPPIALLACAPQVLNDPESLTQGRNTGSVFQTIVPITERAKSNSVAYLIGQVLRPSS